MRSEAAVVAVKLEATEVAIEIDDKNACDSHVIIFDRFGLIGLALESRCLKHEVCWTPPSRKKPPWRSSWLCCSRK